MTYNSDLAMGLFLSDILGGPEQLDKPFDKKVTAICKKMELHKAGMIDPEDGTINIVFQYPGSLLQPEFSGVRTGSFSKKRKTLVVQVAVPADAMSSKDFVEQYLRFLKDALV